MYVCTLACKRLQEVLHWRGLDSLYDTDNNTAFKNLKCMIVETEYTTLVYDNLDNQRRMSEMSDAS